MTHPFTGSPVPATLAPPLAYQVISGPPRPITSSAAPNFAPLVLLALLVVASIFFVLVPAAELGTAALYLGVISIGLFLLYQGSLKRVDPTFPAALFVLACLAKFLGSLARYWMIFSLYDGASDTPLYYEHGQILAQYFKVFDFSIMQSYTVRGEGTTMLAYITGFLFTVLPVSMAGAFFFFSALAFAGTVFCYRAARVAWPTADLGNYRLFIFFLPSILFWPASLGKDAWILCWSGLVAWGWVSFTRQRNLLGLLWVLLALLMLQLVRPHIAAFLSLGMVAAYAFYSTRGQGSFVTWFVGGIAVIVLGYFMIQNGARFLQLEDLSFDSLQERIEYQQHQTTQGGSRYQTVSIFTPSGFVTGLLTAAIRPFPWEANSPPMLVASFETMGWLFFCWRQRRAFLQKLRSVRSDPVAGFALFYTVIMLLALTSFGNFGIVARQRVMALPFLWMLFV